MEHMFGIQVICSDEECAEIVEVVAPTLEEAEALVCEGCQCTVQVLSVWEVEEARVAEPAFYVLPLAA